MPTLMPLRHYFADAADAAFRCCHYFAATLRHFCRCLLMPSFFTPRHAQRLMPVDFHAACHADSSPDVFRADFHCHATTRLPTPLF
jgi:hypothetical protein